MLTGAMTKLHFMAVRCVNQEIFKKQFRLLWQRRLRQRPWQRHLRLCHLRQRRLCQRQRQRQRHHMWRWERTSASESAKRRAGRLRRVRSREP